MVNKSRLRVTVSPPEPQAGFPSLENREPTLSERDFEVLRLIVEGYADKEIARALGVSVFTINKSVQAILRYTSASSRTHAAVKAIKLGLVD